MALILPTYSPNYLNYRIPDNITSPVISKKDYFYTPDNKNFMFKEGDKVTSVNIDFWGVDNSYFNNNAFTTI